MSSPVPSMMQRVRALLATPATLKEINDQLAAAASSLAVLKQTGEALQPQIEELRSQLEVLRLQATAANETGDALRRQVQVLRLQVEWMKARQTTYMGNDVALTYLEDDTPIYVNAHDFGGSVSELVNGGQYEPNNLEVLFSFLRDDSVFLDIGANVGFFSLQVAKRVRSAGKVFAFEPHPELFRLLCASAFLNGLGSYDGKSGIINVMNIGASDQRRSVTLNYPVGHLGGGTLSDLGARPHTKVQSHVHPLDSVFPSDFKCDLVKIDVESHELHVLRGMQGILERSPDVKIIFEKLGVGQGDEREVCSFLHGLGFKLFLIGANAQLIPLDGDDLPGVSGYIVTTRNTPDDLDRRRFRIYPRQLSTPGGIIHGNLKLHLDASGTTGQTLFFGPFWFLRRGTYLVRLQGIIAGDIAIGIASRTGVHEFEFHLSETEPQATVFVPNDVFQFECVARSTSELGSVSLEYLELIRQA